MTSTDIGTESKPRTRIAWWRIVGWVVTLAAFGFIGRWLLGVDTRVWQTLRHIRLGWLLLSVVIIHVWFFLRIVAWDIIIRRHGYAHGWRTSSRLWMTSEILRYIPGNVWSFAGRFRGATSGGVDKRSTVHALMLEAGGLLSGAAIVTLGTLGRPWIWLTPVAAATILLVGPAAVRLMMRIIRHDVIHIDRRESTLLLAIYIIVWLIFGVAHIALFRALVPTIGNVAATVAMSVSVFSWFIGYVTIITPMGLGVREAVFSKSIVATTTLSVSIAGLLALIARVWLVLSEVVFFLIVMAVTARRRVE